MSSLPLVDLAAQRDALGGELEVACLRALARSDLVLGQDVAAFEGEFAGYCGVAEAVGVDSGMSAIELILRAFDVGPGDEVIVPATTFVGTTFPVVNVGAKPVLVDVDEETRTLAPDLVAAAITPATRAVLPVHLHGQCAAMEPIRALARERDLLVLEDACQAHGARRHGSRAGSLGDAAAFSFYPSKNLGGAGDGGMVVTDDRAVADRIRVLRNYGQRQKYRSEEVAFNRRLDTLQAALLRVKLRRLDEWNAARRVHAARYHAALEGLPVRRPRPAPGNEHVWHVYAIRVRERDAVQAALAAAGIATAVHYPLPIHLQPAHRDLGHARGDFPVTERLADELLSLPMYPELPDDAPARVAAAIASVLGGAPTARAAGGAR